jgi:hypothetical protein
LYAFDNPFAGGSSLARFLADRHNGRNRPGLALALLTLCGLVLADGDDKGKLKVRPLSTQDVVEKLDGKAAKVTPVEVTLEPGQASHPHRHPRPVFGYVLEGEYEWAIDDQPAKKLKAGEGHLLRADRLPPPGLTQPRRQGQDAGVGGPADSPGREGAGHP